MGQPGDLLLIFADALTRSWKQIIKFRTSPEAPAEIVRGAGDGIGGFTAPAPTGDFAATAAVGSDPAVSARSGDRAGSHPSPTAEGETALLAGEGLLAGLIRDERGVRLAPETED